MAIAISLLALLATFYQLYLQRVHNAKSLKPLAQIVFEDHTNTIAIRLFNYGLGPLIIDRITFTDGIHSYNSIKEFLDLDVRLYNFVSMDDLKERVILPNSCLTLFEKEINIKKDGDHIRKSIALMKLSVKGKDVYDKIITLERSMQWFARHMQEIE